MDASKRADRVEALLAQDAVISVQVLHEFANVLRKKRHMPWPDIAALSAVLLPVCDVHNLSARIHQVALDLAQRYTLSFDDATIVAAAGLSGCAVLCSEDMPDGLNLVLPERAGGGTLSISNPFA